MKSINLNLSLVAFVVLCIPYSSHAEIVYDKSAGIFRDTNPDGSSPLSKFYERISLSIKLIGEEGRLAEELAKETSEKLQNVKLKLKTKQKKITDFFKPVTTHKSIGTCSPKQNQATLTIGLESIDSTAFDFKKLAEELNIIGYDGRRLELNKAPVVTGDSDAYLLSTAHNLEDQLSSYEKGVENVHKKLIELEDLQELLVFILRINSADPETFQFTVNKIFSTDNEHRLYLKYHYFELKNSNKFKSLLSNMNEERLEKLVKNLPYNFPINNDGSLIHRHTYPYSYQEPNKLKRLYESAQAALHASIADAKIYLIETMMAFEKQFEQANAAEIK